MGTLDNSQASRVKRKIAIENITAYSPAQIVNYYNTNLGEKGWKIIQFITIGTNRYIIAEKEY